MALRIVFVADVLEAALEDIPYHDALADVQVAQRIEMYATRIQQVFVGTFGHGVPGMLRDARRQVHRSAPAEHDRTLVLDLPMSLWCDFLRLGDADHPGWDIHPLGSRQRILRALSQLGL